MVVKFNACCLATYKGELELPKRINAADKAQVLSYILDHIDEVPCSEMEYIGEADNPVTEEDIYYIGE